MTASTTKLGSVAVDVVLSTRAPLGGRGAERPRDLEPQPQKEEPTDMVELWVAAADDFELNSDFDMSARAAQLPCGDLPALMAAMKAESSGKLTIQVLADKLLLHKLVANMDVPQMPCLLAIEGAVVQDEIEEMLRATVYGPRSEEIVVKPSHLSGGTGVIAVSRPKQDLVKGTARYVGDHVRKHMRQRAEVHESAALRSLRAGFLAQPLYQSEGRPDAPLELRVVVLWGKARLAVWWHGRGGGSGASAPLGWASPCTSDASGQNTWFVRRPVGERLGALDAWEPLQENPAPTQSYWAAVRVFRLHVAEVAAAAERVAVAVGAPFLRLDFFVGDQRWGPRLNEAAYGCGMDYRARPACENGPLRDDAPAIARILQRGFRRCAARRPPEHFLRRLGAQGSSYEALTVAKSTQVSSTPSSSSLCAH